MTDDERKAIGAENRRLMPAVARILDEFRQEFGQDTKLISGVDYTTGYEIREGEIRARKLENAKTE